MAAGLPFLKLGSLLVKQLAKPLTARLKVEANRSPRFKSACVYVGQKMHSFMSRITVLASGYKFIGVKPLPEEEAMKNGIETITESTILSIAASLVIFEYSRGEKKNQLKAELAAEKEKQVKRDLEDRFQEIENEIVLLKSKIIEIEERMHTNGQVINPDMVRAIPT